MYALICGFIILLIIVFLISLKYCNRIIKQCKYIESICREMQATIKSMF